MIPTYLLHQDAHLPQRHFDTDAGLDLAAVSEHALAPQQRVLVSTGVAIQLPKGSVGLIWPRSKLAVKFGIDTLAGVIDSSYRGEIKVLLINHGDKTFHIRKGDRIAQLVIQAVQLEQCYVCQSIDQSERGEQGINSPNLRLQ